jgi:hypothetical protein
MWPYPNDHLGQLPIRADVPVLAQMETKGEVRMASAMYSLERAVLSSLHAAR